MFCRHCGVEIPEDSAFCAKCGKPTGAVAKENTAPELPGMCLPLRDMSAPPQIIAVPSAAAPPEGIASAEVPQSKIKKGVALVVGVVLLLLIAAAVWFFGSGFGTINENNIPTNAVYNTNLGVSVRLGQPKKEVDKLLGTPEMSFGYYHYDSGLTVAYGDGKVTALEVQYPNKNWVTHKKIGVGTATVTINSMLGKGNSPDGKTTFYYFQKNGQPSLLANDGKYYNTAYYVSFRLSGGEVMDFFLISMDFKSP